MNRGASCSSEFSGQLPTLAGGFVFPHLGLDRRTPELGIVEPEAHRPEDLPGGGLDQVAVVAVEAGGLPQVVEGLPVRKLVVALGPKLFDLFGHAMRVLGREHRKMWCSMCRPKPRVSHSSHLGFLTVRLFMSGSLVSVMGFSRWLVAMKLMAMKFAIKSGSK